MGTDKQRLTHGFIECDFYGNQVTVLVARLEDGPITTYWVKYGGVFDVIVSGGNTYGAGKNKHAEIINLAIQEFILSDREKVVEYPNLYVVKTDE